jgi:hypothetical protein
VAITTLRKQIQTHIHSQKILKFFAKYEQAYHRTIQPKQLAYVNVERHGGATTVPKYGCWLEIADTNSNQQHNDLRLRFIVGRTLRSNGYHIGGYFMASRSVVKRIDIKACLDFEYDDMGEPILNATSCPQLYSTFASFIQNILIGENHQFIDRYLGVVRGNPSQRLADKAYRWTEQPLNHRGNTPRAKLWNRDTYQYNRNFRRHIKADLQAMGQRFSANKQAALVVANTPLTETYTISNVISYLNALREVKNNVSNRFRYTSEIERRLLDTLMLKVKTAHNLSNADGCGHYIVNNEQFDLINYGTGYCRECYDRIVATQGPLVEALTRNGTATVLRSLVHTWSDGSLRTYSEPPVIGNYHSSKDLFTKSLPHITGQQPHKSVLKLGYELEFCRKEPRHDDNYYARKMKSDINTALGSLVNTTDQPYCGFERDGSVDFEMVSGYGPIDIHRAALIAMLQGNPYAADLQSHNGGRCGFHVHLDKPESLMHAVRLQGFYNNPFNENLIRAIARRYKSDGGYARIKADKGNMVQAAKNLKQRRQGGYYGTTTKRQAIKQAITTLTTERYEVVNYMNERTAEIRIFRGSMITSTLIACLEFAFMSWYFSRDTPANQLTSDNFLEYISRPEWRHETGYVRRYLWGKGFKVWMPRKKNQRVAVVEA